MALDDAEPVTIKEILDRVFQEADKGHRLAQALSDGAIISVNSNPEAISELASFLLGQIAGLKMACYELAGCYEALIQGWPGRNGEGTT